MILVTVDVGSSSRASKGNFVAIDARSISEALAEESAGRKRSQMKREKGDNREGRKEEACRALARYGNGK